MTKSMALASGDMYSIVPRFEVLDARDFLVWYLPERVECLPYTVWSADRTPVPTLFFQLFLYFFFSLSFFQNKKTLSDSLSHDITNDLLLDSPPQRPVFNWPEPHVVPSWVKRKKKKKTLKKLKKKTKTRSSFEPWTTRLDKRIPTREQSQKWSWSL